MGKLSNRGCERNEIWHKGSLVDEDDARTLNTCIAQRKRDTTLDEEEYDVHFS